MADYKDVTDAGNSTKTVGRPFPAGKSGNPLGRPKTPAAIRAVFDERTPAALENLWLLATDEEARHSDRFAAIRLWLAYSLGQPVQSTKMVATVTNAGTFAPERLTPEQLRDFLALAALAKP